MNKLYCVSLYFRTKEFDPTNFGCAKMRVKCVLLCRCFCSEKEAQGFSSQSRLLGQYQIRVIERIVLDGHCTLIAYADRMLSYLSRCVANDRPF